MSISAVSREDLIKSVIHQHMGRGSRIPKLPMGLAYSRFSFSTGVKGKMTP